MAPECARGSAVTAAADVYGLGKLTAQLLQSIDAGGDAGTHVAAVIAKATAEQPAERHATIDEFLSALDRVAEPDKSHPVLTPLRNPYKGLSAFREADAEDFFGRSQTVAELVSLLETFKFVAVVGPSGSGKSSLVHAGLIRSVRAGSLGNSSHWVVADMFPGPYPLEELASALSRVAVADPGGLIDELERDERGLSRVIRRVLPKNTHLLLVIDQFEELFTLTRDETTRSRLLDALVALATDEQSETRVVITLRADFFDRPLQYPAFGELLKAGVFPLTVPDEGQLMEAMRRPAETAGATWDAGLSEQILDDVGVSPGMLPLLQYALTELFATRTTDQLTHETYRQTGGVVGALARRADEVFAGLDPPRQGLARQLLLRLVTVQPSGEVTRHRTRLMELNALGDPGDVTTILRSFGDARLLVFDRDPVSRTPTVEVAHEALLSRWPAWLHGSRKQAKTSSSTDDYGKQPMNGASGIVTTAICSTGGRLTQFEGLAEGTDLALAPPEAEYLQVSREHSARELSRRRRIRNVVTGGFATAAVVATLFAVNANRNEEVARSRELAASAINVLNEDPELSLILALQAAGIADPPFESVSALHESLAAHHKIFTYQYPVGVESTSLNTRLSPDGTLLAAKRRRQLHRGGRG